jgi:hypothetical protein
MKVIHLATACFVYLAAGLSAKADYIIKQTVDTGTGTPMNTVSYLKGNKIRVDMGSSMSIIRDSDSGDMSILSPATKSVRKIPGAQMKALEDQMKKAGKALPSKPDLKSTGNHQTINGFPCEEFTFNISRGEVHVFIDKDFPNYQKVLQAMQEVNKSSVQSGLSTIYMDQFPGMPIKAMMDIMGHKLTTTLLSIDEKPVDGSQFTVPSDYTVKSMPGMPGTH